MSFCQLRPAIIPAPAPVNLAMPSVSVSRSHERCRCSLRVVQHLAHRVAVMYLGHIVGLGDAGAVFGSLLYPYTQALLRARHR